MEVTNCRNCPFRITINNDWSMGCDSSDICGLQNNIKLLNPSESIGELIIRTYNEFEDYIDGDQIENNINPPEWCPLQKIESLEIKFKFD